MTAYDATADWWGDPDAVTGTRRLGCWLGRHRAICGGWTSGFMQYLWCRCGATKDNMRRRWVRSADDFTPEFLIDSLRLRSLAHHAQWAAEMRRLEKETGSGALPESLWTCIQCGHSLSEACLCVHYGQLASR